jgi:large subunit ribosomal protein L4e
MTGKIKGLLMPRVSWLIVEVERIDQAQVTTTLNNEKPKPTEGQRFFLCCAPYFHPSTHNHIMAARQLVSVYSEDGSSVLSQVALPAVFKAPIRPDVVNFVHSGMNKNARQPYAVSSKAGHQTSAESWGTGRAVARIPRVAGGGTSRSGQAAFGNMCRGGHMYSPTKIWRKWHVHVNQNQKRYAVASALAASALPALVMARGHKIDKIAEIPLVVAAGVESFTKTKQAVEMLKNINAYADVEKVADSKKIRAGKGKMRNRRHTQRRGPLLVYEQDNGLVKAFRNVPGVELCPVDALNLLLLAPGGHVGRFIVWTQGAFGKLDALFGTEKEGSKLKKSFVLPQNIMNNADITRIINSDEIQSVLRPAEASKQKRATVKKNPLRNLNVLLRLNPYAKSVRRGELLAAEKKSRDAKVKKVRNTAFVRTLKAE